MEIVASGKLCFVASRPAIPLRDFLEVEHDLERVLMRVRNTHDPTAKRKLLRHLRELIEEADLITALSD
jgi:hypothetical protein